MKKREEIVGQGLSLAIEDTGDYALRTGDYKDKG